MVDCRKAPECGVEDVSQSFSDGSVHSTIRALKIIMGDQTSSRVGQDRYVLKSFDVYGDQGPAMVVDTNHHPLYSTDDSLQYTHQGGGQTLKMFVMSGLPTKHW